ncbi:hypothetical protein [Rhizorhabdus phycosphaerae]|uniref:hypothetical protein n=1 Tax=Rhizorhabdus phycosphaerae TaxID=2711156 RepID=UPI0013ECAB22|nr:hypothetical protein [Rhizorhabdus phycosphaerae]
MPKSSVAAFDVVAANNSDIGGINIAEGCPAAGLNDAVRELMAQIAAWRDGPVAALLPKSGGAMTGAITDLGAESTIKDPGGTARKIGYRNVPLRSASSSQTLSLSDVGQLLSLSAGDITVPTNATAAFALGDAISIYNNASSSRSISGVAGVTLRLAGATSTGSRTLGARGLCTLVKVGTDEWVVAGAGVS